MNLDELRAVQDREREKDSLQHLRDSFYEEVGSYIADLRAERERRADQADDPFADPEVRRLTDEIETAEEVAESIYERRMGKVVKTASLAAAGYTADTEGLTGEEVELFDDLVDRIEANQETVLDVLSGSAVAGSTASDGEPTQPDRDGREQSAPEPTDRGPADDSGAVGSGPDDFEADAGDATAGDATTGEAAAGDAVAAGDAAGATPTDADGDPLANSPTPTDPVERSRSDGSASDAGTATDADTGGDADGDRPPAEAAAIAAGDGDGESATDGLDAASVMGDLDRLTVRITDDVGEIVGVDGTAYDLVTDDVVTLPEENAAPLLEKDAADRVE